MEYLNTKEKIWKIALSLFATKGYDGVSVRDIATSVGIKESSLYKHYKSKEEILQTILSLMEDSCRLSMKGLVNINPADFAAGSETDEADMIWICNGVFFYFLEDEYVSRFRHLLCIEQYKNKAIAKLYDELFFKMPTSLYEGVFGTLLAKGLIPYQDAKFLSQQFYAPVFFLLCQCDIGALSGFEAAASLAMHISEFYKKYCTK